MFSSKMLVSNYQYTRHLTIMRQAYYLQFHTYKNLPNYIMPNRETLNRSRFGAIQHLDYCIAPLYTFCVQQFYSSSTFPQVLEYNTKELSQCACTCIMVNSKRCIQGMSCAILHSPIQQYTHTQKTIKILDYQVKKCAIMHIAAVGVLQCTCT